MATKPAHSESERITELEIQLAHQAHSLDELSGEVHRQNAEIDRISRHLNLLLERASEEEAGSGPAPAANERPPHW